MNLETGINHELKITLREINAETVRSICNLKVKQEQNRFIAPVAVSIAQAYIFNPKRGLRQFMQMKHLMDL